MSSVLIKPPLLIFLESVGKGFVPQQRNCANVTAKFKKGLRTVLAIIDQLA
jgi:hypothetical protein